jgi:apolipoprotein D and lipocalin family protein
MIFGGRAPVRSANDPRAASVGRPERWIGRVALVGLALAAAACSVALHPEIRTVQYVDLPRFMGNWYVIASIPTKVERSAFNSMKSYALEPDGTIQTTYTFREGAFDGEESRYTARGIVVTPGSNALWEMRLGRFRKIDYRIVYLAEDYSQTVVGQDEHEYLWIMARTPTMPIGDYGRLARFLDTIGYDVSKLRLVPQRWD